MNIGDIIKINDIDLLVLDFFDGNPFMIALDLDFETEFGDNNNYVDSTLRKATDEWLENFGVPTIPREVDLTTMDGSDCYGSIAANAAPLTFDEFRKYANIIIPNINDWFWLCTGWSDPKWDNWGANFVCIVSTSGAAGGSTYAGSRGLAPAFILDKNFLLEEEKAKEVNLSAFTTEDLLAEVSRRLKEGK